MGHITHNCTQPGGGAYNPNGPPAGFPGVDDAALRRPPRRNEARTRTLPSGQVVHWCSECGRWGDHLRAEHPVENHAANVANGDQGHEAEEVNSVNMAASAENVENISAEDEGAFARLRRAGLF